jgi:outer membrane protein OmpA-like peptidoglycan-associated protein
MGRADCIGQNRVKTCYIFDMPVCRRLVPALFATLALAAPAVRADPGDVESSHDYLGFTRPPGFVISDYDEDNPSEFNFPIAQPLPDDAAHVVPFLVKGHRYVIRYELNPGARMPTLFQTQQYYERLASDGGFTVEKSGAIGDVTETFYKATESHQIWVYLEPAMTANVLTVVESTKSALPSEPPRLVVNTATLPPPPVPPKPIPLPSPTPPPESAVPTPAPAPTPEVAPPAEPTPETEPDDANGESLFTDLNASGRVVVPFVFQPGRDALDESSQPLINRIAAMMKSHPDLFLRIEGHTDNSGYPDDNMRLSAQRALAVQDKLVAADIDKKRLDAVGVGGLQPLASNDTAEGREKNRRIELVLWKKNPAFHPNAPNGNNYYPGGNASSTQ